MSARHDQRFEAVGDAAWRLAVALLVWERRLPAELNCRMQGNAYMAGLAHRLGLHPAKGRTFELHVAGVQRDRGMAGVMELVKQLCADDLRPDSRLLRPPPVHRFPVPWPATLKLPTNTKT